MDIGIAIESVLVNKSKDSVVLDEVRDEFNNQKIALFPFASKNILGYQAINEYLDENSEIFRNYSDSRMAKRLNFSGVVKLVTGQKNQTYFTNRGAS